ncbi:18748_t:CDS:2, partial [Dentiscutata erythropus]
VMSVLPTPSSPSYKSEDNEIVFLYRTEAIQPTSTLESEPGTTNNGLFNEVFVKCKICNKLLKYADDASTSNLRKHLKLRTHINKVLELDNNNKK